MLMFKIKDAYGRHSAGGADAFTSRYGKVWASRNAFHNHLAIVHSSTYKNASVIVVSVGTTLSGWEVPFTVYCDLIRGQKTNEKVIAALDAASNLLICKRIPND